MEFKCVANAVSHYLKGMIEYFSLHLIVAQNTAIITIVSFLFRCLFVNA